MQRKRTFESDWVSYHLLKDDLREMHQENLNWLFEEVEVQFLNEITSENEEERKNFAKKYYRRFLKKMVKSENEKHAEFGKFGLDLLYLQFPDL